MYWFPFFHREAGGWAFNPLGNTRIMGVLQRIALCYFFGSLIVHYCSKNSGYYDLYAFTGVLGILAVAW
jgi:predicted acyltransferase